MQSTVRKPGVVARGTSFNKKLSPVDFVREPGAARGRPYARAPFVSSTYTSIRTTCTSDCPYLDNGCFASSGFTKMAMKLLDDGARERGLSAYEVVRNEALAVRELFGGGRIPRDGAQGGRDLRLHVGGDTSCDEGTVLLAEAAEDWRRRGGGRVWTYTHRWREISAFSWGNISAFASVERLEDIPFALARGYAVALTVEQFERASAYPIVGKTKLIPCPAETRNMTCVECRLCLDRDLRKMNAVIGFQLHGQKGELTKAKNALAAAQKRRLPILQAS